MSKCSIKPGVLTGSNLITLFDVLKKNYAALPAVNCIGNESINASLEAAKNSSSPIIIQFSHGGSSFISGNCFSKKEKHYSSITGSISGALHVHIMAKKYNVPVILHTDHCSKKNLKWIDNLLFFGKKFFKKHGYPLFTSHMVDFSDLPLKENIELCSKYLRLTSEKI